MIFHPHTSQGSTFLCFRTPGCLQTASSRWMMCSRSGGSAIPRSRVAMLTLSRDLFDFFTDSGRESISKPTSTHSAATSPNTLPNGYAGTSHSTAGSSKLSPTSRLCPPSLRLLPIPSRPGAPRPIINTLTLDRTYSDDNTLPADSILAHCSLHLGTLRKSSDQWIQTKTSADASRMQASSTRT